MTVKYSKITLIAIIMLVFLLSSCMDNNIISTPVENPSDPTQPQPTLSPTTVIESEPSITIKKLLIYHPNFDDSLIQKDLIEIVSVAESLGFEVTRSNELSDVSYTSIVLFDPTEETLANAQQLAEEQVIVVGDDTSFSPTIPTTLIKISPAETIFIAGYFSALITNDWRVGGLLPDNQYNNTNLTTIFQNGVIYLCGRCTPVFGPIVKFPVTALLTAQENTDATMQAFSEIADNRINTLFIPSIYLYDDLVTLLQQNSVKIISDSEIGPSTNGWVDYAITTNVKDIVISILSNESQSEELLTIIPVEYSIQAKDSPISVGRENFLKEMIANVQSGLISPYQVITD